MPCHDRKGYPRLRPTSYDCARPSSPPAALSFPIESFPTRCVLLVVGLSLSLAVHGSHIHPSSVTPSFPSLPYPSLFPARSGGPRPPSLLRSCHPRVRVALPFYCLSNGSRRNVRGEREGGRGSGALSLVDGIKWDGNGNGMG